MECLLYLYSVYLYVGEMKTHRLSIIGQISLYVGEKHYSHPPIENVQITDIYKEMETASK